MNALDTSRLELARRLRELADGSSEAQLRAALSRSYYSIYHIAKVLVEKVDHRNISEELGRIDPELGRKIEVLKKLRNQADYTPDMVEREFGGDLDFFRSEVRRQVDEGLFVYKRILRELESSAKPGDRQ